MGYKRKRGPQPEPEPEPELFLPEYIVGIRVRKDGVTEYKIKWKGYPNSASSWETPEGMYPGVKNAGHADYFQVLVKDYERRREARQQAKAAAAAERARLAAALAAVGKPLPSEHKRAAGDDTLTPSKRRRLSDLSPARATRSAAAAAASTPAGRASLEGTPTLEDLLLSEERQLRSRRTVIDVAIDASLRELATSSAATTPVVAAPPAIAAVAVREPPSIPSPPPPTSNTATSPVVPAPPAAAVSDREAPSLLLPPSPTSNAATEAAPSTTSSSSSSRRRKGRPRKTVPPPPERRKSFEAQGRDNRGRFTTFAEGFRSPTVAPFGPNSPVAPSPRASRRAGTHSAETARSPARAKARAPAASAEDPTLTPSRRTRARGGGAGGENQAAVKPDTVSGEPNDSAAVGAAASGSLQQDSNNSTKAPASTEVSRGGSLSPAATAAPAPARPGSAPSEAEEETLGGSQKLPSRPATPVAAVDDSHSSGGDGQSQAASPSQHSVGHEVVASSPTPAPTGSEAGSPSPRSADALARGEEAGSTRASSACSVAIDTSNHAAAGVHADTTPPAARRTLSQDSAGGKALSRTDSGSSSVGEGEAGDVAAALQDADEAALSLVALQAGERIHARTAASVASPQAEDRGVGDSMEEDTPSLAPASRGASADLTINTNTNTNNTSSAVSDAGASVGGHTATSASSSAPEPSADGEEAATCTDSAVGGSSTASSALDQAADDSDKTVAASNTDEALSPSAQQGLQRSADAHAGPGTQRSHSTSTPGGKAMAKRGRKPRQGSGVTVGAKLVNIAPQPPMGSIGDPTSGSVASGDGNTTDHAEHLDSGKRASLDSNGSQSQQQQHAGFHRPVQQMHRAHHHRMPPRGPRDARLHDSSASGDEGMSAVDAHLYSVRPPLRVHSAHGQGRLSEGRLTPDMYAMPVMARPIQPHQLSDAYGDARSGVDPRAGHGRGVGIMPGPRLDPLPSQQRILAHPGQQQQPPPPPPHYARKDHGVPMSQPMSSPAPAPMVYRSNGALYAQHPGEPPSRSVSGFAGPGGQSLSWQPPRHDPRLASLRGPVVDRGPSHPMHQPGNNNSMGTVVRGSGFHSPRDSLAPDDHFQAAAAAQARFSEQARGVRKDGPVLNSPRPYGSEGGGSVLGSYPGQAQGPPSLLQVQHRSGPGTAAFQQPSPSPSPYSATSVHSSGSASQGRQRGTHHPQEPTQPYPPLQRLSSPYTPVGGPSPLPFPRGGGGGGGAEPRLVPHPDTLMPTGARLSVDSMQQGAIRTPQASPHLHGPLSASRSSSQDHGPELRWSAANAFHGPGGSSVRSMPVSSGPLPGPASAGFPSELAGPSSRDAIRHMDSQSAPQHRGMPL